MDILVELLLLLVQKKSLTLPFSNTSLVASSYNDPVTSISRLSMLYSFKTRQRPPCQGQYQGMDRPVIVVVDAHRRQHKSMGGHSSVGVC